MLNGRWMIRIHHRALVYVQFPLSVLVIDRGIYAGFKLTVMSEFIVEYPYSELYDKATLYRNSEGRYVLAFRNSKINARKVIFTTTLARYKMSVKLGRFLKKDEHVDHIDEDRTNDDISNLQILTPEENALKYNRYYLARYQDRFDFTCENCGKDFTLTDSEMKMKYKQAMESEYKTWVIGCSSSCAFKIREKYLNAMGITLEQTNNPIGQTISQEIIDKIRYLYSLGYSGYRIALDLKLSRNTVMKYIRLINENKTYT